MGDGAQTVEQEKLNLNFPCDFAKHNTVLNGRARFFLRLFYLFMYFFFFKHS